MHSALFPKDKRAAKLWILYVVFMIGINAAAIQAPMSFFLFPLLRFKVGGCFAIGPTIFWLVVPLIFLWRRIEWADVSFQRWHRRDWALFLAATGVCCAMIFIIPLFPDLTKYYVAPTRRLVPSIFLPCSFLWVLSWLLGWEFVHRFILLRSAAFLWPKWGWLVVPLSETIYHLQKPLSEAAGMAVFSLVLTHWSWKRRNCLLPLLVHFLIEVTLIVYLVWVA